MILHNSKMQVTPEQSAKIQEILFYEGIFWLGHEGQFNIRNTDLNYLYIDQKNVFSGNNEEDFRESPLDLMYAQEVIDYYEKQAQEQNSASTDGDMKFDSGKPRFDLIPPHALLGAANVLEFGARKYAANSWKEVKDAKARYTAALLRHMNAIARGETHDAESGLLHSHHVTCNALFLAELEELEING